MALSVLLRMQDQMTAPVKRAQESLGAFKRNAESIGRQVGFERVTENFSRAGEAGRELYDTAGRVGRRLAAVSAAGAAALTGITVAVANSADELAKFADQMDIPVESLQEWQYAAERMGVSQSTFNSSLAAFSRRLADARDGTGALHSRLKETNPELLEQLTHARDTNEALSLYMRAMEGAADQTERNGMAAAAFSRAGMDMSRMVRDGADEIDRLRERARDLGFILSDETARQGEQFADQMLDMRKSMLGLRNIIGGALMPAFGDLMDQITAGVLYVQPLVREWAEGFAADLPGRIAWLRGEFDALMVTINPALELGAALVERFGALHVAAGALALMIGAPLIVPLVKFTAAMVSLGWALGRVGFALVGLAVKALPAVLAGLKTLALAAMAHPVLATVALLAGGAALLIANWDRVGPFFRDTWATVSDATRRGWEAVTEWLGFDPLAMLEPLWRPIGDWLGRQLDAWKRLLSGEWGAVKEIFRWSPLGLLVSGFGRAREWLAGLTWRDAAEGGWSALKALYRWSPLGVMQRGFGRALEYLGGVDWQAAAEAGWSALKALYRWSPLGVMQRGFGQALDYLGGVDWQAAAEGGWSALKALYRWSPLGVMQRGFGEALAWLRGVDWQAAAEAGWSALKALYRWSPLGVMQRGFGRALEYLGGVDWPAAAEAGWSALKALYRWSPLGLLQRGFGGALAWLRDHWDALTAEAGWAWDVLKGILAWSPLATIEAAWGGVADWFGGMWDGITERAERAIGWIADRLEWVGNAFSRAAGALGISRNDEPVVAVAGPGAPTRMPRRDAEPGGDTPPAEPHPLARSRELLGSEPAPAAQDEAPAWVREWQRQRDAEAAQAPEAAEPLTMARRGAPEHERRQGGGTTVQRVDFRPQITIEAGANANAEDLANLLDERLSRYRDETMWEQAHGVEAD
ncbi:hypothetical protein Tgr7_1626 [Thioalkalivibrio sulfidiphilus HL-EbGr7]|uniref:Uncharacterized protein n=1 Tax=Thioalkalivibrio sulfidiphilus (strain HL-EbGR7) TaxID=396588 RepID=B8GS05_THISH|nr:hypothetical protein [Thioalkalivibrio sulfidiphilus]ACL72709.1 hypothetical protein Tgr7_1626 [Thioalkalivibrio sulfidiphilus HL-EbGr7]